MTICETERLILREITSEDAEYDYLLNQDPEVLKYTGETAFESIEAAKYFLEHEDQYKKYGFGRWAVIDKTENNFLGWCGLKYTSNPEELDLGFRFNKKYWNIDFAAESVKACVNLGFNRFGMETIVGRAVKENTDFIHLFEKIGLKYYRDSKYIGQAGVIYKIEKTEIPSVETAITKSEKSDSLAQVELPETASDRLQTVLNMYTPGLFILSEAEYNYSPSANKWSKKEILGHLIDSAANNHQRIIRSQYEAVPTVVYDANQ
jgi:RimJ/RimL family protein N-acetyltransferase